MDLKKEESKEAKPEESIKQKQEQVKQEKPEATPAASKEKTKVAGKEKQKIEVTKEEPKQKPDKKDLKIQELTNIVKKVQADFENYKKQQEKEKAEFCKYASQELVKKLLPLLDSFQLALKNKDSNEFKKGVELIYSQFWQILESEGLKTIEALGKELDPFCHEALLQEESDKPENTVLQELQKGYVFKDAVLRPAKVKIAKKPEKKEAGKK